MINNSEERYWICRGSQQEPHPEEEVEKGDTCPRCGRDFASIRQHNTSPLPWVKILGGIALLALLGGLAWWFLRPKPDSVIPQSINSPENNTNTNTSSSTSLDYNWQPERFTRGQRTLFPGTSDPNRDNGIAAFKQGDYTNAIAHFKRAVEANRNDPEVLILYNNAKARQQGNPLTLAAAVPVEGKVNSAEAMLRGVAMAQNQFNNSGGTGDRLLEIVIANDGNDPKNAAQVAQQLVSDPSVLGVIGHNASDASQAALKIYEKSGLPMISPTSTSTALSSKVFFRTLPSDAAAAQKLAQYITEKLNLSKVVIFYNPNSDYSRSLQEAFVKSFSGQVIRSVDLSTSDFQAGVELARSVYQEQAQAALLFPNTTYTSVAREIAKANATVTSGQQLKLLGGDSLYNPDTLIAGGESMAGLILAVPWFVESPTSEGFKKAGNQQWGGLVNWRTAMSYDATQALIVTLSDNSSPASILKGLSQVNLSANQTSGIELKFTSNGERQSEPILVEAVRGASVSPKNTEFGFELVE
jgi:branched-chain amino acid transport system substrate-binding protein